MSSISASAQEDLPLLARIINHVLTPGSSLTSTVWVSFNVIMVMLALIWLMFVVSMPDNVHVWSFGFLGAGLAATTNWFMYEIFKSGDDFHSRKAKEGKEGTKPNGAGKGSEVAPGGHSTKKSAPRGGTKPKKQH
jgi:hypothetical protein